MASEIEVGVDISSLDERFSSLELRDSDAEELESSDGSESSFESFDSTQCLFCNCYSEDLDDNLDNMRKRHGMIIPYPESLIVDLETLLKYLHLVIYEYTECLFCGSIRNTPQASQQHMTGKGHCKIDIEKENSEFRDFYDLGFNSESDGDGFGDSGSTSRITKTIMDVEDGTRRLLSGKIVTHRRALKVCYHGVLKPEEGRHTFSRLENGEYALPLEDTTALVVDTGKKKKDLIAAGKPDDLFNKHLATMSLGDRLALAHLPLPQQRALAAKAKKQQERWNRFESDQTIKRQCKTKAK